MAVALAWLTHPIQAKPDIERNAHLKESLPQGWRLHERQPHWLLASRPFPEHGQKEYFAELNVEAPPEAIIALLQDTQRVSQWVHHGESATLLEELSPEHYRVASRFNPPWPIRNRDLISESRQWKKGPELWLEIQATPSQHPPQEGYVRIEVMQNCWLARQEPDGSSTLFHLGHVKDPGYSPNFLVNTAMTQSLLHTLENLQATLPEYQDAELEIQANQTPEGWRYCGKLKELMTQPWPTLEGFGPQ